MIAGLLIAIGLVTENLEELHTATLEVFSTQEGKVLLAIAVFMAVFFLFSIWKKRDDKKFYDAIEKKRLEELYGLGNK